MAQDDGRGLARLLATALRKPGHEEARTPAWLRVADHDTAAELRNELGDRFEVRVAPTPELDQLFDAFVASMPAGDEDASYLEDGRVSAGAVARMFEAAAFLYRVAPWKGAAADEVLRMDIPALGVQGACVSITGALGESLGLVILPSLLAFERLLENADVTPAGAPDLGGPVLSLDFWRARDMPRSVRREMGAHGWTPASPDAIPVVTHRDRDGVPRPLTERDVRIATECAYAVASFFVRHREVFGGGAFQPVCESSSMQNSGPDLRRRRGRRAHRRRDGARKLVNTDGEDLVLTTDHFDVAPGDRARVEGALCAIEGIEEEAAEGGPLKLALLRPGNAVHAHWDNTVVAHLVLEGDRLRVETNSKQRADRLRALVEQACAPSLRHRLREHADPTSSAHRTAAPRSPHEPTAEEREALRQLKQQHYRAWLDAAVPALGGKTPRQAVRTASGRRQVDVLLRSFENGEHRMSDGEPFDFMALRAELGLDVTAP